MLRWMVHWSTRFNGGNWYFSWELHHRCLKFILSCKSFIQPNWEKEHALVFNKFQKLSITTNLLCVLEYIWNSTFNFLIFCQEVNKRTSIVCVRSPRPDRRIDFINITTIYLTEQFNFIFMKQNEVFPSFHICRFFHQQS